MADDQCHRMQGKVFPVRGRRYLCPGEQLPAPPGPGGSPCGGVSKGLAPGSRVGGGGGEEGFAAWLPPPLFRVEYASVAAGRTPRVTDQDLRRSEAWLGNRWRLAGMTRAIIAGPLPQVHHCGRGQRDHLSRLPHGAGGHVVRQLPQGRDESRTTNWSGLWVVVSGWGRRCTRPSGQPQGDKRS
jgi:hypothetical protein